MTHLITPQISFKGYLHIFDFSRDQNSLEFFVNQKLISLQSFTVFIHNSQKLSFRFVCFWTMMNKIIEYDSFYDLPFFCSLCIWDLFVLSKAIVYSFQCFISVIRLYHNLAILLLISILLYTVPQLIFLYTAHSLMMHEVL